MPVRHGVIQGVNGLDGISQEYASSISLALKGLNGVSSAGIFIEKKKFIACARTSRSVVGL